MLVFSSGLYVFKHVCFSSGEVVVSLIESHATCDHGAKSGSCHLPGSQEHLSCCKSASHCHIDKNSCCRTYFKYFKVKTEYESGKRIFVAPGQPVVLHPADLLQDLPYKSEQKLPEITHRKIPEPGRKIFLQIHQIKIPVPPVS